MTGYMITLIHGDDVIASRNFLQEKLSNFPGGKIVLDGKALDPTALIQAVSADSLFSDQKLVVIENFFSNKKTAALPQISTEVIFYESKLLSAASIPKIKDLKIAEFKIAPIIFKLVNALRPGAGPHLIPLFRECLKIYEPEFIFAMVIRQFRLTKLFSPNRLKSIYQELLELDYKNKTSQLVGSFASNLKMFLFKI